jgi:hypothetical protein
LRSTVTRHTYVVDDNLQVQQRYHDQLLQQLQRADATITTITSVSRQNHAESLHHNQQTSNSLAEAESTSTQQHATTHAAIHERATRITKQLNEAESRHAVMLEKMHSSCDNLGKFKEETYRRFDRSQQSLHVIDQSLQDIQATTMFSAPSVDTMTKVFRNEMQSFLHPILEQSFTRSEARNEALLERMERLVGTVALELGRDANQTTSQDWNAACVESVAAREDIHHMDVKDTACERSNGNYTPTMYNDLESPFQVMESTYRRTWKFDWRIGILRIEIRNKRRRLCGSPQGSIHTEMTIQFSPRQTLVPLPGIVGLYSNGPDHRGFYQIAPMFSIVPIIKVTQPVWAALRDGDLVLLENMLSSGEADLRMQDEYGCTLLHVSSDLYFCSM